MYIAIADRDQREFKNGRYALPIMEDDDNVMSFESAEQIRALYANHPLNAFSWWAFDMDSGESEEIV